MSSKMLRPLYTTLPWSPADICPNQKDRTDRLATNQYLRSPDSEYHAQTATMLQPQPQLLSTVTYNHLISPLGPDDIPPAPASDMTGQDIHQNQVTHSQYPTAQSFTPSPWSNTSQQLLTPQYPFFPANVFAYPQPQPQPQPFYQFPDPALQNSIGNNEQEHVIPTNPYPYPINTQQNATDDLFQHDQYNTVLAYSTASFGIVHQDDMFQPQHEVLAPSHEYKSNPNHDQAQLQPHSFSSRVFDHPDTNSIIIDSSHSHTINRKPKSNIFRSDNTSSSSAAEPITIDPKLSSWGNLIMGGEQRVSGFGFGGTISDRTSAIPTTPILPIPESTRIQGDAEHDTAHRQNDGSNNPSPTKRARWSSSKSTTTTTTPLRKRRPPQLHLPPPTSHMRIPATSAHTAPAATFSLDLFVSPPNQGHGHGRRLGDSATILPQEPPKIDGWVSPDERPVPPVGYVLPGWESTPKIFEYDVQHTHLPVVEQPPSLEVQVLADAVADVSTDIPSQSHPSQPPAFQPYEPICIPPMESNPRIRVPNTTPCPPPTPYILVPGVNGFEVVPWRPKPQATLSGSTPMLVPPTTAAPWEVSAPPIDPSLPPSTASSWESITSLDGHFPIPPPEAEPVTIISDHRGRGKSKPARTGVHPPPRYYNPPVHRTEPKQQSVICEICDAYISRTSDLPRHMRKHTGEKPYQCQYCACSYARNDKLSNHIAKNHPGKPRAVHKPKFDIQQSSV